MKQFLRNRPIAKCFGSPTCSESEFETAIDLHIVVLRPVHNLIAGVGKNSDVRRKPIFETATHVPENIAMMTAAAGVHKQAADSAISITCQVEIRRQ